MDKIEKAQKAGFLGKLGIYGKMSGPGWLQAAVTLGGGSLGGALYLGVIGGYGLLWLQPLAMIFGVIMLSALAYVTLSTKETPFVNVCKNISPLLAWAWLIGTVVADCVFCPAQASLGLGVVQQNFGFTGGGAMPFVITSIMSLVAFAVVVLYSAGTKGVALFENILKVMVGLVVLCFFATAVVHIWKGGVDIASIFKGLIPNPSALFNPAETLEPSIQATGEAASYWRDKISNTQRGIIITAFGATVAINMTFLLPYTLRKRNWNKKHRELSRFDLSLGLGVPFIIATAFLVLTSIAQFHDKTDDVLNAEGMPIALEKGYYDNLKGRVALDTKEKLTGDALKAAANALPMADKKIAAAITKRDADQLAVALAPLVGEKFAQYIFGFGVLAMALSTMIVHMLMNGFAVAQAVGNMESKKAFLLGAAIPAITAALTPLLWSGSNKTAMLVPASVIATTLLPIAYLIFILLINSKKTLGDSVLTGGKKIMVNVLLMIGLGLATFASFWALSGKKQSVFGTALEAGQLGMICLGILAVVGVIGFMKNNRASN